MYQKIKMKNSCSCKLSSLGATVQPYQQINSYIHIDQYKTYTTLDIFYLKCSFPVCHFSQLLFTFSTIFHCNVSPNFRNENSVDERNGRSMFYNYMDTLSFCPVFPIDRESPKSYSSILTDLGRSTPRERRGTPEKEV